MATQPACTYYAYNVPADMTGFATMIGKETDCKFHITSVKQHNETALTFEKPVLLTQDPIRCGHQEVYLMPEMVRKCTLTLRRQWTNKLNRQDLDAVINALPGVRFTGSENGEFVLESRTLGDLCKAENIIKQLVIERLASSQSSIGVQSSGLEKTAHEGVEVDDQEERKDASVEREEMSTVELENEASEGSEPGSMKDDDRQTVRKEIVKVEKKQREGLESEQRCGTERDEVMKRYAERTSVGGSDSDYPGDKTASVKTELPATASTSDARGVHAATASEEPRESDHDTAVKEPSNKVRDKISETNVSQPPPPAAAATDERQSSYVIDEPLWAYIQFIDPQSQWDKKFSACRDNEMTKLTGSSADIDSLKKFCDGGRLKRAVIREMQRVPEMRAATVGAFLKELKKWSHGKVLVQLADDEKYCELVGKKSDIDELKKVIDEYYPRLSDAIKKVADDEQSKARTEFASAVNQHQEHQARTLPYSPYISASQLTGTQLNSAGEFQLCTPASKLRVKVITGDLLKQCCEILVNPSNSMLVHQVGLSKLLADAAGYEMELQCREFLYKYHMLQTSHVLDTTAGKMSPPVRHIIHACGPNVRETYDLNSCGVLLERTFFQCFIVANDKLHARSIAVPAISSGVHAVPCDVVATAAYNALMRFDGHLVTARDKYLTDINFVNIQEEITSSMIDTFQKLFQLSSPPASSAVKDAMLSSSSSNSGKELGQQQLDYRKMKAVAEERGLAVVDVAMDGDCAFHAVNRHLQQVRNASDIRMLRRRATEFLGSHPQLVNRAVITECYGGDVKAYLNQQAVPGTLCDQSMLHAVAAVIRRPIHLLNDDGNFTKFEPPDTCGYGGKPITIGLIAGAHYVSLEPLDASSIKHVKQSDRHSATLIDSTASVHKQDQNPTEGQKPVFIYSYSKLKSEAEKRGYVVVDVQQDSDSALHAVIRQLQIQGNTSCDVTLLRNLVDRKSAGVRRFSDDERLLRDVSEVIMAEICVIDKDGHVRRIGKQASHAKPVVIGTYAKNHYVSLETTYTTAVSEPRHSSDVVGAAKSSQFHHAVAGHHDAPPLAADAGKDEAGDTCAICMDRIKDARTLPCTHVFCSECIAQSLVYQPKCPCCGQIFGVLKGDQPDGGTMTVRRYTRDLEGYPSCGCLVIEYLIPSGRQKEYHPSPGDWYASARRTAYLPGNAEGEEICELLRRAFNARLIFTVGRSTTSGRDNVVTWNDIHHKTKPHGPYGYPDASYLARVREELAAKGITSDRHDLRSSSTAPSSFPQSSSSSSSSSSGLSTTTRPHVSLIAVNSTSTTTSPGVPALTTPTDAGKMSTPGSLKTASSSYISSSAGRPSSFGTSV